MAFHGGMEDQVVTSCASMWMPIEQRWKQLCKLAKDEESATKQEIVALYNITGHVY